MKESAKRSPAMRLVVYIARLAAIGSLGVILSDHLIKGYDLERGVSILIWTALGVSLTVLLVTWEPAGRRIPFTVVRKQPVVKPTLAGTLSQAIDEGEAIKGLRGIVSDDRFKSAVTEWSIDTTTRLDELGAVKLMRRLAEFDAGLSPEVEPQKTANYLGGALDILRAANSRLNRGIPF